MLLLICFLLVTLPGARSLRCEQCQVDLSTSTSLTRHMKTKKHREVVGQSMNQELGLVPPGGASCPRKLSKPHFLTIPPPPIDQAPVLLRDPGIIGNQIDGTSYNSTALDQAPRFFQDPSGVPTQLDPAWLSRKQAPPYDQSYGRATAQLQREDQPTQCSLRFPIKIHVELLNESMP